MKKIISLILILILTALCTVPSYSATVEKGDGQSGAEVDVSHTIGSKLDTDGASEDVYVTHSISEGYVITVPERIALSASGEVSTEISASQVAVSRGKKLTVSLTSDNYDSQKGWQLVARGGFTLGYNITKGGSAVTPATPVLECAGGSAEARESIAFSLGSDKIRSVSYTDMLTFTVSVE